MHIERLNGNANFIIQVVVDRLYKLMLRSYVCNLQGGWKRPKNKIKSGCIFCLFFADM